MLKSMLLGTLRLVAQVCVSRIRVPEFNTLAPDNSFLPMWVLGGSSN